MAVSNPKEVPEYELNPLELEFRRGEEVTKACVFINFLHLFFILLCSACSHELWVLVIHRLLIDFTST